jgi:hypothetical protein
VQQAVAQILHRAAPPQSAHVLEVSGREALHFREGVLQVCCQAADDLSTPAFAFLTNQNVLSDPPIQDHQLAVDRNRCPQLRLPDAPLQCPQQGRIVTRQWGHPLRRSYSISPSHGFRTGNPHRTKGRELNPRSVFLPRVLAARYNYLRLAGISVSKLQAPVPFVSERNRRTPCRHFRVCEARIHVGHLRFATLTSRRRRTGFSACWASDFETIPC